MPYGYWPKNEWGFVRMELRGDKWPVLSIKLDAFGKTPLGSPGDDGNYLLKVAENPGERTRTVLPGEGQWGPPEVPKTGRLGIIGCRDQPVTPDQIWGADVYRGPAFEGADFRGISVTGTPVPARPVVASPG